MVGTATVLGVVACAPSTPDADGPAPVSSPSQAQGSPSSPTLTIAFSGDLLVHTAVAERARANTNGLAYDFRPMLEPVRAALSQADLAICHLETPLSPDDSDISGYPVFNAPHELADAISFAGYDACSTASNHAFDQGTAGIDATLGALDGVGVGHAGTARTPAEAARTSTIQAGAAIVALLDYTYPGGVGAAPPWAVRRIEPATILADATAARSAGADLVVVTLHWGEEYRTAPTSEQSALARQLLASPDVDLVVGGHVHVVQPVERIGDKFVVYGVGNFLSNQSEQCCPVNTQDGVVVTAHASVDADGHWSVRELTFTPTWVDRAGYRVLPVAETLDDPATPTALHRQLSESWRRTVAALTSLGPVDGLRPDRAPTALSD